MGSTYTCADQPRRFTASTAVSTTLPWSVTTGLPTVPVNVGTLLYGKCTGETADADGNLVCPQSYSWVVSGPAGSSVTALEGANTRSPWFTPDIYGLYVVEDTQSGTILNVYADEWKGAIDPARTLTSVESGDGRPVGASNCTGCHNNFPNSSIAPDKFLPWRVTGHAEIFTQNIDNPGHYGTGCFSCHTVGYDPTAENNGFDDQDAYPRFIDDGYLNSSNDAWYYMLADLDPTGAPLDPPFPEVSPLTRFTNVQCENCHGPQLNDESHGFANPNWPDTNTARISISSDVCGSCHGEPLRHARFQQWQISGHADYDLAIREGERGNCARCHSGDGFIQWTTELANDPNTDVTVTWNADTVHPQTCVTCHEPHDTGNVSGDENNAKVRNTGGLLVRPVTPVCWSPASRRWAPARGRSA